MSINNNGIGAVGSLWNRISKRQKTLINRSQLRNVSPAPAWEDVCMIFNDL